MDVEITEAVEVAARKAAAVAAEATRAAMLRRISAPLSTKEAAVILGRTRETLRQWRVRGIGPKWRMVGKRAGYELVDLEEWLKGGAQ